MDFQETFERYFFNSSASFEFHLHQNIANPSHIFYKLNSQKKNEKSMNAVFKYND